MKNEKAGPLSETDLRFLDYYKIKSEKPVDLRLPARCRVFNAVAQAGIDEIRHWFIYLLRDCSNSDIEQVKFVLGDENGLFKNELCYVVVPKMISDRVALQPLKNVAKVLVFEDLIWSQINKKFGRYMEKFQERIKGLSTEIHYIEPPARKQSDDSIESQGDDSIEPMKHLIKFFSGESSREGLQIVTADAAVGKSTLAVKIGDELAKNWQKWRVIPILLTGSSTWREVAEKSQGADNFWDVLSSALNLDGPFPVNDEELFAGIAQKGYIALIFDGFDELRSTAGLSPRDNFKWLSSIAKESNARILVTARTSFWQREVGNEKSQLDAKSQHEVLELLQFDREHAYRYFDSRFNGSNELCQKAKTFYAGLSDETGFKSLPVIVDMIADHVRPGGDASSPGNNSKQKVIREIMSVILNREQARQEIATDPETLEKAFRQIAINGEEIEDLEILDGVKIEDIRRLPDHAWLKKIPGEEKKYRFKHEFLLHYLRVSHIIDALEEDAKEFARGYKGVRQIISPEASGDGPLVDLMPDFVDEAKLDQFVEAYRATNESDLKSFLFHAIVKTIDKCSVGESRADRADKAFQLLGSRKKEIDGLVIKGSIGDIAIDGWTIRNSKFTNLSILKHGIDKLRFVNCHFLGSLDLPKNAAREWFEKCDAEEDARLTLGKLGSVKIHPGAARGYLRTVLKRFRHGQFFRSIQAAEWKTGKTSQIEEKFGLLDFMELKELVRKTYYQRLEISPSNIGEVRDFLDNGSPKGVVKKTLEFMEGKLRD